MSISRPPVEKLGSPGSDGVRTALSRPRGCVIDSREELFERLAGEILEQQPEYEVVRAGVGARVPGANCSGSAAAAGERTGRCRDAVRVRHVRRRIAVGDEAAAVRQQFADGEPAGVERGRADSCGNGASRSRWPASTSRSTSVVVSVLVTDQMW